MYEREQYLLGLLQHIYKKYELTFHIILTILIIYAILYTIVFFICMYKFAKKEKQPVKNYVIPFINWWYYFKLCKIPAWLVFIPILNIIAHIVSPFNLAYQYKYKMSFGAFGFFLPIVQLPMIAFGSNKNRQEFSKASIIKKVKDIDIMEAKLEKNVEEDYDSLDFEKLKKAKKDIEKNKTDEMVERIEANAIKDDYEDILYGDDMNQKTVAKFIKNENIVDQDIELIEANEQMSKQEADEEIIELDDDKDLKISMKEKEADIENKSNIKITDDAEYKDFEFLKKDNSTIAFGGQKEVQKKARNVTEEKYGRNRCPRCNTPVNETMDVCPGCGYNLRQQ